MYAPTAAGARWDRPERAKAKMTSIRPTVATTSESQCGPDARCFVEIEMAASENMALATIAPKMHPSVWKGKYAAACFQEIPPNPASTNETIGLKCAPETGPNIKIMANS